MATGPDVPLTRSGGSLNFVGESHAFGSRPAKEALPRIGQRFSPHLPQLLPESPFELWQVMSHDTRHLLIVGAASAAFLHVSLEISELRPLEKPSGGKRTKRRILLMLGLLTPRLPVLGRSSPRLLRHTFLPGHWVFSRCHLILKTATFEARDNNDGELLRTTPRFAPKFPASKGLHSRPFR